MTTLDFEPLTVDVQLREEPARGYCISASARAAFVAIGFLVLGGCDSARTTQPVGETKASTASKASTDPANMEEADFQKPVDIDDPLVVRVNSDYQILIHGKWI